MNPLAPVNLPEGAFLGTGDLLLSTLAWIGTIACVAAIIGWCAGSALVGEDGRLRRARAIAVTVPLCIPAYLAFWSVWHQAEPTSWFGDRVLRAGAAVLLREGVLVLSMALWAAPFVAWCVAMGRLVRPDPTLALRALDGLGWLASTTAAWRRDRESLALGWIVAFLALMGESVSFDLAQVRTYGFELRSLDLTGAPPSAILLAAWPAVGLVVALLVAALLCARRLARPVAGAGRQHGATLRSGRLRPSIAAVANLAAVACIAAPPALLLAHRWSLHDLGQFIALHARPTATSLTLAAGMGALVAAIAVGLRTASQSERRSVRAAASSIAFALMLGAAVPATLVVVLHERLWNNDLLGPAIYDTPVVVVLALLTRVGVVAVLCAALIARSGQVERLARLDRPRSTASWWKIRRPAILAVALTAGVVGAGLAFSEIAASSRLVPPGMELLATSTLNAIHYQQPEIVLISASGSVALGLAGAIAVVALGPGLAPFRRTRQSIPSSLSPNVLGVCVLAVVSGAALGGCGQRSAATLPTEADDPIGTPRVPCISCFGTSGYGPGQFRTPRGVAYDEERRVFYVVDKEARIQRFGENGEPQASWRMPEFTVGKPVGLSVHPDGRVFVADTHYNRVMVFDSDGHELARFGAYGKEPGHFIYPTDIAFGNDGRIYVGEYGGNDRVQIFSPTFEVVGSIGAAGVEEGQFSRPQGLAFDRTANELYVADSNNHRIVVYGPDGDRLRQFGVAGIEVGQLSYPRGIVFCGDGSIMVVEFGNHRVQRFVARAGPEFGKSLGIWGGMSAARLPSLAPGRGVSEADLSARARSLEGSGSESVGSAAPPILDAGRLQYPWDMAGRPGHVMILDSGHDRVMIARLPS